MSDGTIPIMPRVFKPLLLILTCATRAELIRQVQYLKVENQILRGKLSKRITCHAR